MNRWRIEPGMDMPRRGPKRKYAGLPLSEMEKGDSVKVAECAISQRTPTYISVRKAIAHDLQESDEEIRGEFKVSTKSVGNSRCEVRVWRVR